MSGVINNVLKQLSDLSAAADSIAEENAPDFNRLSEWTAVVRDAAKHIVESENPSGSTPKIPSLTAFIRGKSQKRPRASTLLTEMQKKRLHVKKGRASTKRTSLKPSFKTSLPRRKSNLNQLNFTDSEDTAVESSHAVDSTEDTGSSTSSDVRSVEATAPQIPTSKTRRSSKRKSSSEVTLKKVKKTCYVHLVDIKDRDKPIKNTKIEKLANFSSGASNTSVLKENRTLRSKIEKRQDTAVETRKNIMALRQQKLQQNKRSRGEKLEMQPTQKMNLEKTKLAQLRSGGGQGKFKTSKTKEATPKANVENETLAITASSGKYKEKETALKKIMAHKNLKKAGNEKTPTSKHETDKRTLNNTYVSQAHEPSTSGFKGKTVRDPNITDLKSTKAMSNDNKTETLKEVKKTGNSLNNEKDLLGTPIAQKRGPESYAITPTRSSIVSYDISEIRSDSEEEEGESSNSKPIPQWAVGVHLRNALLQQHHHPIETDELFGNYFEPPDLTAIMGVKNKAYNKRTSSAVWNSSIL